MRTFIFGVLSSLLAWGIVTSAQAILFAPSVGVDVYSEPSLSATPIRLNSTDVLSIELPYLQADDLVWAQTSEGWVALGRFANCDVITFGNITPIEYNPVGGEFPPEANP